MEPRRLAVFIRARSSAVIRLENVSSARIKVVRPMASLAAYKEAVRVQWRVIFALVLRETRVAYGATSLGYFWAFAEPVFSTALLVLVFSSIVREPPIGSDFALFFATGILIFQLYKKLAGGLMGVFGANKGLLAYPLVKTTDVIFARALLIAATTFLVMTIFFAALILLAGSEPPKRIHDVLMAYAATLLLGISVGVNYAVLVVHWPTWRQVEGILSTPLFFISGIFFVPEMFAPELRYWLSWNPIMHCIEWFREGYFGYYSSTVLDQFYLFGVIAVLGVLGFGSEMLFRRNII